MKKLIGMVSMILICLMAAFVPMMVNAESNPSPTATDIPEISGSVVVTKADGSTQVTTGYTTYSITDLNNGKIEDTQVAANLTKANQAVIDTKNVGELCSGLNDVAKELNSAYDASVYDVTDLFEFNYELGEGETITVTFEVDAANSACMHLVNGTEWKLAQSSQAGKSLTVTFDSLCPVAIVTVNQARATAMITKANTTQHSHTAIFVVMIVLLVVIAALLALMIVYNNKNMKALAEQTNRVNIVNERLDKNNKNE